MIPNEKPMRAVQVMASQISLPELSLLDAGQDTKTSKPKPRYRPSAQEKARVAELRKDGLTRKMAWVKVVSDRKANKQSAAAAVEHKKMDKIAFKAKTMLCPEYMSTGKCPRGRFCFKAHSMAELSPPVFFDRADVIHKEKKRLDAPVQAEDYHEAYIEGLLKRDSGYLDVLGDLSSSNACILSTTSSFVWSAEKLARIRQVSKATVQVSMAGLQKHWFLNEDQTTALKKVLGPRYDPSQDSFRLVRRVRKPDVEILNPATVHDKMIRLLYETVQQVKLNSNFKDVYFHDNTTPILLDSDPYLFEAFPTAPPRTERQTFSAWLNKASEQRPSDSVLLAAWLATVENDGVETSELLRVAERWQADEKEEVLKELAKSYSTLSTEGKDLFRKNLCKYFKRQVLEPGFHVDLPTFVAKPTSVNANNLVL